MRGTGGEVCGMKRSVLVLVVFLSLAPVAWGLEVWNKVVINEVHYYMPGFDAHNEYIELLNAGGSAAFLDGAVITDEGDDGMPESVFRFPGSHGGYDIAIWPGEFVLIAVDAVPGEIEPDLSGADWEFVHPGDDNDNPDVPNLIHCGGSDCDIALANSGDGILLATGVDTSAAIDCTSVVDGVNWDNVPGTDSEILRQFLIDDLGIDWAENATINKTDDNIHIFTSENNSANLTIDVQSETAELEICDGRTLDLKVKEENGKLNIYKCESGDVYVHAKVSKVYYLAESAIIDTTSHDLAINETADISVEWPASTVGERLIAAIIDTEDVIIEYNEFNNVLTKHIAVQTADIEVSSISLRWPGGIEIGDDDTIRDNSTVQISATVTNIGIEEANNFDVQILVDDIPIANETIPELASGSTIPVVANWTAVVGKHVIKVEADYANLIVETNETNNIAAKPKYVCGAEITGHTSWETFGLHGEIDTIIDEGNRFDDNLAIVSKFMELSPTDSIILSNGEFIEGAIMSGDSPVIFIGANTVPAQVIEFVESNEIKGSTLIGNELVGSGQVLKDATGISVIVKFGQGRQVTGEMSLIEDLDKFYLPRYELSLDAVSAQYNEATKQLEIIYRNDADIGEFFKSSVGIMAGDERVGTVGDDTARYIEPNSDSGRAYDIDLTTYVRSSDLSAIVTSEFGEAPGSLNLLLTKILDITLISAEDDSKISVSGVNYDKGTQRLELTVVNTGSVPCYASPSITMLIKGDEEILRLGNPIHIEVGEKQTVSTRVELTSADLADNPEVPIHADYGERSEILVKNLNEILPLNVTGGISTGILLAGFALLLIIAAAVVWSRRKTDAVAGTGAKPVICSNCGESIPGDAQFCPKCGAVVE